jgi:hypothetical protein
MRLPLRARMARSVLTTSIIGSWCMLVLKHTSPAGLMVITFAWTAAIVRRLLAAEQFDRRRAARPSTPLMAAVFLSQIVWSGTAVVRLASDGAWFWQPSTVPFGLVVAAGIAAAVWSLRPVWSRFVPSCDDGSLEDLDRPILACLFFLLSGSLVFAAATWLMTLLLIVQRLYQTPIPVVNYRVRTSVSNPTMLLRS